MSEKRIQKRYAPSVVWAYIKQFENVPMDIIDGALIDTYIIYHKSDLIEVFEEVYQNCWSSVYIRHIYKKLPKRFIKALEDQEAYYNEQ